MRYILKQLFTSVLVKVVDIYLAASMDSCEMVCTLFAFILLNFFFQIFTPSPKFKAGLDLRPHGQCQVVYYHLQPPPKIY